MKANLKEIKTKRHKKAHELTYHEKIAQQVGCSVSMVQYILAGKRNQETKMGQKILIAAAVIEEEENKLLQAVKLLISF